MDISGQLSLRLDFLRWFSACVVVVGHIRNICFVPLVDINDPNLAIKIFYFLTGFGHPAVMVFFVLSGFLIGGKILLHLNHFDISFSWKEYLVKRVSRLYAVLFIALIFGGILDYVSLQFLSGPGSVASFSDKFSVVTFIGNFLMLQESIVPIFGSNEPLWSLAYEFWYYILFPIFIFLGIRVRDTYRGNFERSLFFYLLLMILLVCYISHYIFLYFSIWILGAISIYNFKFKGKRLIGWVFICFGLIIYRLNRGLESLSLFFVDFIIALGVAFLVNNMFSRKIPLRKDFFFNKFLADFSYTLYLIHYPLIIFFFNIFIYFEVISSPLEPNIEGILIYFIFFVFVYLFAFLLYLPFEKNTKVFREYLFSIFRT